MSLYANPTIPFFPYGNTVRIAAVTPTPPTAVQLPIFPLGGDNETAQAQQVRIRISSGQTGDIALGWGKTAAEALANAEIRREDPIHVRRSRGVERAWHRRHAIRWSGR